MKQTALVFFLGVLTATRAFGTPPPYLQSVDEISSILKSKAVSDALGGVDAITAIKKAGDVYEVATALCTLKVKVQYQSNKPNEPVMMGLLRFELKHGAATCAGAKQ
jgi:hypothetical protein